MREGVYIHKGAGRGQGGFRGGSKWTDDHYITRINRHKLKRKTQEDNTHEIFRHKKKTELEEYKKHRHNAKIIKKREITCFEKNFEKG